MRTYKKKIVKLTTFSFLLLALNGCNQLSHGQNDKYIALKKEFNSFITSHFPERISSVDNLIISNTNSEKNDVGLFLIEFNAPESYINSLEQEINAKLFLGKYSNKDICLLKVNPFETIQSKENLEIVIPSNSAEIDKPCYSNKLPIPNFIDYEKANKTDFWQNDDFTIYVLDAKPNVRFNDFQLQPNPQMPSKWRNGYSKGIAIDKIKRTVIYWGIVW